MNLDQLTEGQKYALLEAVVNRFEDDAEDVFQNEPGRMNLIGVRGLQDGEVVDVDNVSYDDTMFVVYRDDNDDKHVSDFEMSAELGHEYEDNATALLSYGHHAYKLGYHNVSRYDSQARLSETDDWQDANGHWYRALEPDPSVRIGRDVNHDNEIGSSESTEDNSSINIHWGGENSVGSAGCQVIRHWTDYKEFIRLVEEDHSIRGTVDNELAEQPETDGDRSVIYTLVTGEFVEEVYHQLFGASLPVDLGEGLAVTPESVEHAYRIIETGPGGYFPVGAEQVWHGGRLERGQSSPDADRCM